MAQACPKKPKISTDDDATQHPSTKPKTTISVAGLFAKKTQPQRENEDSTSSATCKHARTKSPEDDEIARIKQHPAYIQVKGNHIPSNPITSREASRAKIDKKTSPQLTLHLLHRSNAVLRLTPNNHPLHPPHPSRITTPLPPLRHPRQRDQQQPNLTPLPHNPHPHPPSRHRPPPSPNLRPPHPRHHAPKRHRLPQIPQTQRKHGAHALPFRLH